MSRARPSRPSLDSWTGLGRRLKEATMSQAKKSAANETVAPGAGHVSRGTAPSPRPTDPALDSLLEEVRSFEPPAAFRSRAHIKDLAPYAEADRDFEGFWERFARELEWQKPWDRVLEWEPPDAKWFVGGRINISVNCVDRHVRTGRRNQAAIIWEGEPGDRRTLTYWDLHREVNRFAGALRKLGVAKGDRVAIYLPLIPEAAIAMLACARIGAVHTVVFGGFSAESLRDRILDAQAKVLITADGGYRRGAWLPLKIDSEYAIRECPSIQHVIVVRRGGFPIRFKEGRDHWYHELIAAAEPWCRSEERRVGKACGG